jgi:peptidoglycan/LPS O-acetylase OafA/YrhL
VQSSVALQPQENPAQHVDQELFLAALAHARSWNETRLASRTQIVNFFLLTVAFASAGYGTSLANGLNDVAGAIGVAGVLLSLAALQSDLRARAVLRVGKTALIELEAHLAQRTGFESLRLVEMAERSRSRTRSQTTIASLLYLLAVAMFVAAAAYGFLR